MPRKYVKKRKVIKRRYNRKRYRKRNHMRMSYMVNKTVLQPDSTYTILRYNEIVGRTPLNFVDNYVYTMNSVYDPNFTGTGTQPAGFDQYMTLYGNFQVLASAIYVKIINYSNISGIYYAITPMRSSSAILYQDAVEQSYAKRRLCGTLGSLNISTLKNFMRVKKFVGRQTNDNQYGGTASSNPTSLYYWMLSFFSSDGSTNLTYTIEIQIKYYVKFYNRLSPIDT